MMPTSAFMIVWPRSMGPVSRAKPPSAPAIRRADSRAPGAALRADSSQEPSGAPLLWNRAPRGPEPWSRDMPLRVHHLNCTTMCPPGGRLMDGRVGASGPAALVCHCLLVETDRSLVLVDTGFGLNDV